MTAPARQRVVELTDIERALLRSLLSDKWSSLDRTRGFLVAEDQEPTLQMQLRIEAIEEKLK